MDYAPRRRKPLHLKTFDYKDHSSIYFITICAHDKRKLFADDRLARMIADELGHRRAAGEIRLFCYCIMPDHLHILLSLGVEYGKNLQNWMSAFKRYTTKVAAEAYAVRSLWQRNFYDHVVRKEESLLQIMEYILNNPVRKGIVPEWTQYPYSKMVDDLPV